MFEKLKSKIAELAKQQKGTYKIDVSHFNDPVADKTEWSPLKAGGANFKTHNLEKVSSNLMQYKLSTGGKLFLGLFAGIGLTVAIVGLILLLNGDGASFFFLLFGSMFTGISYIFYRLIGQPIIFDASMGLLWVGKNPPKFVGDNTDKNNMVYFSKIQAIQIISERVRGNKTTYTSYEINMVLKDGTRFNVMDHGNHSQILVDAEDLSAFLGKPIWDVS